MPVGIGRIVDIPKKDDLLIDCKIIFEVGGKRNHFSQWQILSTGVLRFTMSKLVLAVEFLYGSFDLFIEVTIRIKHYGNRNRVQLHLLHPVFRVCICGG